MYMVALLFYVVTSKTTPILQMTMFPNAPNLKITQLRTEAIVIKNNSMGNWNTTYDAYRAYVVPLHEI